MGSDAGPTIAALEIAAPQSRRFILRGTFPIPPKLYFPNDAVSPFKLRAPHGLIFRTQVEVVSRYPSPDDGADVVEVIAKVQKPPGVSPGTRLTFDVLLTDSEITPHKNTESVRRLVGTPKSVMLRARDVFGHAYDADLLEDLRTRNEEDLRILRTGAVAMQTRGHENLLPREPVSGALGTLPHMMGVHSYVTTWHQEDYISLDLRVHNGHDGLLPGTNLDNPMGKLYFRELELVVPEGWVLIQAYPTPSMGEPYLTQGQDTAYPIVAKLGGGDLHVMPPQGQFHRRFVLAREGEERKAAALLREEGLAFCVDGERSGGQRFYSWWNPRTSRYWAQNMPLPSLDYLESPAQSRSELRQEYEEINQALTNGTPGPWPLVSGNMGWAHPYGLRVGNMHGGTEIYFFDGVKTAWGASRMGYRSFQMTHRMYSERHPTALFDLDGDPFSLEDWLVDGPDGPILPTWIFMVPWLVLGDPFGFTNAPQFQVNAVANQGRQPEYEEELLDYQWIDAQHLIRYTRSAKTLAWLGNDAVAKDDLRLQAELCRATYSVLPQNELGWAISTGLLFDREYVESNPGDGFIIDRGEGWILDTVASAYALGTSDFRRRSLPWFKDVVDLITEGQSDCWGTIMSKPNLAHFNGQYRILQSISETILQNGLWGVMSSVYKDNDNEYTSAIRRILKRSTNAMISANVWDETTDSPHFYTALGPYDQSQSSFCNFVPPDGHEGNDGWQTWNMLVFGYLISNDHRFMHRATAMAGGTLSPAAIGQDNHPGELETRAGMISFLQARRDFFSGNQNRISTKEDSSTGSVIFSQDE